MKITLADVRPVIEQAWMAKQDAIVYFGYANHEPTFQKLLKKFKEHDEFKKFYMLPTYKVPIIRIDKFEDFLREEDIAKYKRKR